MKMFFVDRAEFTISDRDFNRYKYASEKLAKIKRKLRNKNI